MAAPITADVIEAVLKVTERCNINCSYCYMFNRGYDDFRAHPVRTSEETIVRIGEFLRDGALQCEAKTVHLILHGGEPMMMKPAVFERMCQTLRDIIVAGGLKVRISMQTNAILVTEQWIPILARNQIGVGVSIDGPKEYHDSARVDHRGRGTYDKTLRGIRILQRASERDLISAIGALCVIQPNFSGAATYRHLVHDLNIRFVDFMLPMETVDSADPRSAQAYGAFLREVFDAWTADNDPTIRIRYVRNTIHFLTTAHRSKARQEPEADGRSKTVLISIASNGDLGPDDDLKVISFGQGTANIFTTDLTTFLQSPLMRMIEAAENTIPTDCLECCWKNYCRGQGGHGRLITRFRHDAGFNSKTAYCGGLQSFFAHVAAYLLRSGVTYDLLLESLQLEHEMYEDAAAVAHDYTPFQKRPRVIPIALPSNAH